MPTSPTLDAPQRMRCPRCQQRMAALQLSSHRGGEVEVDHCAGCRLVWFDRFESVALDGMGWVRLLRELDLGAQRPLSLPGTAAAACPRCTAPLRAVQNQTRFGLFAVQECPKGHGHLHSHSGLLAERGMVRPLGLVERQALTKEQHGIHCLNCGGPAQPGDEACSFCGTALLVLDLPRLLHSLRIRAQAEAPTPLSMGQRGAWACHGCGAALDPARETHCGQCGHLVVAQGLPDIEPLLAAAEAEWTAFQAREAARLARFPSTQAASAPPSAATAAPRRPPPVMRAGGMQRRRTGLAWVLIAAWGVLATVCLAIALSDGPWPRRDLATDFADQRVSDEPGEAWAWLWVHDQAWPNERSSREELQRALFRLHVRLEAGATLHPATQLQALIDERRWAEGGAVGDANDLWQRQLSLDLAPLVFEPPAPNLPPEAGWREEASGLWISPTRYAAEWHLSVRNAGHWPRVIGELELRMPVQRPDTVGWRCQPAGTQADTPLDLRRRATVAPGEVVGLVCKSLVAPTHLGERWDEVLRQLRQGDTQGWRWTDEGLRAPSGLDAATRVLAAHFAGQSRQAAAFLKRHGLAAAPPTQVVPRRPVAGAAPKAKPPRLTAGQRWQLLPRPHRPLFVLGLLMAASTLFAAVSLATSTRWGLRVWMALALPLCWVLGGGEGAASVLWVGSGLALCYVLGLVMAFAFRVFRAGST